MHFQQNVSCGTDYTCDLQSVECVTEPCHPVPVCIPKICSKPKDIGPCRASKQRYFYNVDSDACEMFLYGGCQGNENNFESEEECKNQCVDERDVEPTCSPMMCLMYCEHGFEQDENGCDVCKCKAAPTCSPVMCAMYCEHGFEQDQNGCDICQCKPKPTCSPFMCMMYCEHGFKKDENGCDICFCQDLCEVY